jgi:hypothetical protein
MEKTTQTWIFYGKDRNGTTTIHAIKRCKNPERTAEYKEMLNHLENDTYHVTGTMTSKVWNKEHQYTKIVL